MEEDNWVFQEIEKHDKPVERLAKMLGKFLLENNEEILCYKQPQFNAMCSALAETTYLSTMQALKIFNDLFPVIQHRKLQVPKKLFDKIITYSVTLDSPQQVGEMMGVCLERQYHQDYFKVFVEKFQEMQKGTRCLATGQQIQEVLQQIREKYSTILPQNVSRWMDDITKTYQTQLSDPNLHLKYAQETYEKDNPQDLYSH